ncbi:carboxyl transferase domain-containing protein [Frankia sp. R82]|uniref:carboxyl transferase domain-containing protein n=1 Tax=Frankia sp. R82 TaxID=2950553 RepID=UPI002043E993|nr:carboxyl transferase domain-containing protein [Frankia sp. R82]MCM3885085.1 acetyl-CoA carboxylase subunit alpha/beta [Frankia sp. R82]
MDRTSQAGARTPAEWRTTLLAGITLRPATAGSPNRLGWPDYDGRPALRWGTGPIAGVEAVAAIWDFSVHGGSFGAADAAGFAAAAAEAATTRRPLVSFLRSGGTRLQEGVAGLVGLPRVALALAALDEAAVGHVAVADQPTTGGVWVTIGSRCDLRCAVAGATVGFSGPRVVAAMTGTPPPPGSHSAAPAAAAGLVDAVLAPEAVAAWLHRALTALSSSPAATSPPPPSSSTTGTVEVARAGWEQVLAARTVARPHGTELLHALLPDGVDLAGADPCVAVRIGRLPGTAPNQDETSDQGEALTGDTVGGPRTAVVVALGASRGSAPGPAGYRLLSRAARLAGKLGVGLITLVDTPGAASGPAAETAGIAAAIGDAMAAVLTCPSPTVAIVHGEGGSGGALAATVTDVVVMTPHSYFTALSPEGAAVTLRIPVAQAADAGGLRPVDLHRLGFADQLLPGTDVATIVRAAVALFVQLQAQDPDLRNRLRRARWSTELRNSL